MEFKKVGLGGGCHWCTEAVFQSLSGIQKVEQGWISSIENSQWSEAVLVHFDAGIISLEILIQIHLHTHSCTSSHSMRAKYRSAIYVFNNDQLKNSETAIINLKDDFDKTIITKVLSFKEFRLNKEEYLDYYYSNPEKAFCKNLIHLKLRKLMALFGDKVNSECNELHKI